MRLTSRLALTLALSIAASVVLVTPAAAVTAKQATATALAALKPANVESTSVVVFGMTRPVRAGKLVHEAFDRPSKKRSPVRGKPLRRAAWLFWQDEAYGAKFAHASTLVLVDDKSGKVVTRRKLSFWPLVGGKEPPFVAARGRSDLKHAVYQRIQAPYPFATSDPPHASRALGQADFSNDCLVMVGDYKSFEADFNRVSKFFKDRGMRVSTVSAPRRNTPPDGADLIAHVKKLPADCQDVVIYLNGHGSPGGVLTGARYYTTRKTVDLKRNPATGKLEPVVEEGVNKEDAQVRTADVKTAIEENPNRTFKVIVDSCFSGDFATHLPKTITNMLVLVMSSGAREKSWGLGGFWGSTFSAGLVRAMQKAEQNVGDDTSGASKAARIVEQGGLGSASEDWAQWVGQTHPPQPTSALPPIGSAPPPPPPPPPAAPANTCNVAQDSHASNGAVPAGHRAQTAACPPEFGPFQEIRLTYSGAVNACQSYDPGITCAFSGNTVTFSGSFNSAQLYYGLAEVVGGDDCATTATFSVVKDGVRAQEKAATPPQNCA